MLHVLPLATASRQWRKLLLTSALSALALGAAAAPPRYLAPGLPALERLAGGAITGRVVDAKGEGVPGVTVIVDGTKLGASSDVTGVYTIANVPAGPHTLVFSSIGLNAARVVVTVQEGQSTQVPVTALSENATQLEEAVVVGYGTARRQDVTGSLTTVTAKDFVQGQVTTISAGVCAGAPRPYHEYVS